MRGRIETHHRPIMQPRTPPGTAALPKLFVCSLVTALFVAPLVASFLNRKVRLGGVRWLLGG
jgi:hypothetical protein